MVCRTDLPIRKILQKLDLVGRMTEWVVELSEFDCWANFINELTPNLDDEELSRPMSWSVLRPVVRTIVQPRGKPVRSEQRQIASDMPGYLFGDVESIGSGI
ncbi:hypothetical protein CR513_40131, partial [Mucuna pruriens]